MTVASMTEPTQQRGMTMATKKASQYVIVRSRDAGVFAGDLVSHDGNGVVVLSDARRLWYWDGAASLSQLSQDGVSKPGNCKFPVAVPLITVLGVCEIIPASNQCRASIAGVKPWSK